MLVMGIETSCDETAAAVVQDASTIRSNIICSQIDLHRRFGGVVPEVASRKHLELIEFASSEALDKADIPLDHLDAIAVTHGPGLIGSLLVGVSWAKGISTASNIHLFPINHLEGHVYSNFLLPSGTTEFPLLTLIVSGGHTDLVLMHDHGQYEVVGHTRDDAAGEAFDKVARVLGLGFPGGPAIDRAAQDGDPDAIEFPRADLGESYDFSFSGVKTSVVRRVRGLDGKKNNDRIEDIAASFQDAVVDVLVQTTLRAADKLQPRAIAIAGGVAANRRLRSRMEDVAHKRGIRLFIPPPELCTDNAAMIACAGSHRFMRGERGALDFDTHAYLPL